MRTSSKEVFSFLSFAEELSGIFIKNIAEGSAAAKDGRLQVDDQIVEVCLYHFVYFLVINGW